jgi:hypothetical protein
VIRQERSQEYGYNRFACIEACKAVAHRYQSIRRKLPSGFFSLNVLDLQAFTAAVLLLLMSHSSSLPDIQIFQVDKSGIEGIVAQVLQLMEENSAEGPGSDFAHRGAHTIRCLRDLFKQDESGGNLVNEMTANVPLIGRIWVRRNTQTSQNLSTQNQASSNQAPQVSGWNSKGQSVPTAYNPQLDTVASLQNSAMAAPTVPEFQWDQLLWSAEDSSESLFDDAIWSDGFGQLAMWQDMYWNF